MSQFKYTLPSGAAFTMEAPTGTTQNQADYIFYSQVASGALVGFVPGQSVSSTTSSLAKFTLSRLDRGIAGVNDTVILAIVNGLPTVNGMAAVDGVPYLINVPLENPVTQANIAAISGTGFTAPAIGSLTNNQVQALMAQVVNTVDQPATTITDNRGVGQYGLNCQQLEMAGYVKPGTWQQFIQPGPSTLVEVLSAPGIWTGLNGIYSLDAFLNSPSAQNDAQARLMENGYATLQAAGVITTPAAQSVSAVVGEVYTGSNVALTTATTTVTNEVNSQIGALVTNSSQFGTGLTAQWAAGVPPVTNPSVIANLTNINGQPASILDNLNLTTITAGASLAFATAKTAMDTLGKASQFATKASSTLSTGLDKLSTLTVDDVANKLKGEATALASSIEGKANALIAQGQDQVKALVAQGEAQAKALLKQAEDQAKALLKQADTLVADVKKAAGYVNTVDRASVDVAFKKVLGSDKIPTPDFGALNSATAAASADIAKAQATLQNLQGQGTALLAQAEGIQAQGTALVAQAQGQANGLLSRVTSTNFIG